MKRAILTREPSTDQGTFGALALPGGPTLRTVELPWRGNSTGISCIPVGVYRVEMVNSPRYGRTYGVRDVPGRSNILLHAANWAGDAARGWHTQLQGCIAPALDVGLLTNPLGQPQMAGLQSRPALAKLVAWGAGLPFELEIR